MNCAKPLLVAANLFAAFSAAAAPSSPTPLYHIVKMVPIGAPDRWDYVVFDPEEGRVYVSHGDGVTVIDGTSGAKLGAVAVPGGVTHGIVSLGALGKGYTDDGKAGEAVVFDLKSFTILRRIKAEPDADGIVYDAGSGHVLVIDGDSGKVTVIDPKTDKVVATIDGGGDLEFGVSGGNGKFYVDGAAKNEIVRMDLTTNRADAHWPLPGCVTPHGLAIDRAHMRLFASCGNNAMTILNAETGSPIATLPIGQGSDFAAFDPARGLAFSSNRDGTLSIIAERTPENFAVLPAIQTQYGARTMGLDPKTGRIYLAAADVTINENAAPGARGRYVTKPGTAKLLFLDPQTSGDGR